MGIVTYNDPIDTSTKLNNFMKLNPIEDNDDKKETPKHDY